MAAATTTAATSSNQHKHQHLSPPNYPYQQQHSSTMNSSIAGPSSSAGDLRAPNSPPIPLVRLPSIDQGLPPFSADGGMTLPLRRGSLTDPMLHVHNSSASSSSGMYAASSAGPSGLANSAIYGGFTGNGIGGHGHSLGPGSALRAAPYPSSASASPSASSHYYHAYDAEQRLPPRSAEPHPQTSHYIYDSQPHPLPPKSAPHLQPVPTHPPSSREGLPLFGRTSKTLFPAQHGPGTASVSPTLESQAQGGHLPQDPKSAATLIGIKRKHEQSPSDLQEQQHPQPPNDYFAREVPSISKSAAPPSAMVPSNKRRTSQPYNGPPPAVGSNGLPLPTPPMTVSATSGEDNSAASSERRSSDGSNGDAAGKGTESTEAPYQRAIVAAGPSEQSRLTRIVPRQASLYADDGARPAHMLDALDADTKPKYAFPMQRPSSGASATSPVNPLHDLSNVAYHQQLEYNAGAPPPPGPESHHSQTSPAYAEHAYGAPPPQPPSSMAYNETRPPPPSAGLYYQGSLKEGNLPSDLRDRANAIFGNARSTWTAAPGASGSRLDALRSGSGGPGGSDDSKDGSSPYARSPALKVSHKIAERKRRKEMKELFDELRDCIPSTAIAGGGTGSAGSTPGAENVAARVNNANKASKWEVLAKAIEYIGKIQYESQELVNSVLELQSQNQALQEELAELRKGRGDGNGAPGSRGVSVQPGGASDQLHHHQRENSSPNGPFGMQLHSAPRIQTLLPSSAGPTPSPGTVHAAPPPLPHSSYSMPPPSTHGLHHHQQQTNHSMRLQSPAQSPYNHPISAPPHMQSHPFFTSNDVMPDDNAPASTSPQYSHAPYPVQQQSHTVLAPQSQPANNYVQQLQQSSPGRKHERIISDPSGLGTHLLAGTAASPGQRQGFDGGSISNSPISVHPGIPIFGAQKQQQPQQQQTPYQPMDSQTFPQLQQQSQYGPRSVPHLSHHPAQSVQSMQSQSPQPPVQQIPVQPLQSQGSSVDWSPVTQGHTDLGPHAVSPQHSLPHSSGQMVMYPANPNNAY